MNMFRMRFAPLKSGTLVQSRADPVHRFTQKNGNLEIMGDFRYFGNIISLGSGVANEVPAYKRSTPGAQMIHSTAIQEQGICGGHAVGLTA